MRKLPTGEPCAGEPHARFGGRGGRALIPTPIELTFVAIESASLFLKQPLGLSLSKPVSLLTLRQAQGERLQVHCGRLNNQKGICGEAITDE